MFKSYFFNGIECSDQNLYQTIRLFDNWSADVTHITAITTNMKRHYIHPVAVLPSPQRNYSTQNSQTKQKYFHPERKANVEWKINSNFSSFSKNFPRQKPLLETKKKTISTNSATESICVFSPSARRLCFASVGCTGNNDQRFAVGLTATVEAEAASAPHRCNIIFYTKIHYSQRKFTRNQT